MLDSTSIFIISSLLICGIAGFGSVFIILRRGTDLESLFFSLFLIGMTFYILLYILLKVEALKYLHYPLQTIAIAIYSFGFFMFSYSLKQEGKNIKDLGFFIFLFLMIPPLLCFIFTPFTFIYLPYGYELQIDPWFLTLLLLINIIPFIYATYYLLLFGLKSVSLKVRKKIKIIVATLITDSIVGIIFLILLPILLGAYDLKPIGYYVISISMIIMAYTFKKDKV